MGKSVFEGTCRRSETSGDSERVLASSSVRIVVGSQDDLSRQRKNIYRVCTLRLPRAAVMYYRQQQYRRFVRWRTYAIFVLRI